MSARRSRAAGVAAALAVVLAAAGCGAPPYPTGTRAELAPGSMAHTRVLAGRSVHWVTAGNPDGPPVLFVHGTPGSWQAFAGYLTDETLARRFHLIAVDRPGFGDSGAGELEPSLARQARILQEVLEEVLDDVLAQQIDDAGRAIVVGHSLGGPIAVRLAADAPDRVAGLVLVAPSLDPELEHPRWYNRLADWRPVRWLLPETLAHANEEVMVLHDELQALATRWPAVRAPAVIIQGMTDRLVYPANADYAEARLPADQLTVHRVADAGHFILWEQPQRTVDAILRLADS